MRLLSCTLVALTLGCGVIDGLLDASDTNSTVSVDGCSLGDECGSSDGCLSDGCDLLCNFDGFCDGAEEAYSRCGAANGVFISADFDLFVYDLSFVSQGNGDCRSFAATIEDASETFEPGDGDPIVLDVFGASSAQVQGFTTLDVAVFAIDFDVCGGLDSNSVAIQWRDGPRRSNPMCVVDNFVPQGFGGGGTFGPP